MVLDGIWFFLWFSWVLWGFSLGGLSVFVGFMGGFGMFWLSFEFLLGGLSFLGGGAVMGS